MKKLINSIKNKCNRAVISAKTAIESTSGEGYIQFTIVPHEDGTVTLHLRDNARAFNPFDLDTEDISLHDGSGLDALGVKLIKNKAKEFFYRRYAGFNTLVIRV